MSIRGSWRVATATEPSAGVFGVHSYFFSPSGELVLSQVVAGGPTRILLTWSERGGLLVVDQPSAPREEVLRYLRASEATLQLDESWYVREVGEVLDADAPWWALIAGGTWYGLANASPTEPFVPFLMMETGAQRSLQRVVASSHDRAEEMAPGLLAQQSYERAVWVRDGRITLASGKLDAILAACFEPGGRLARNIALPYRFEGGRARIAGGFAVENV